MPPICRLYKWYVLVTRCNHETTAEEYLKRNHIQVYLPTHKVLRQWSDRKKWVTKPLFPSYIFVRVSILEYEKALMDRSIVRYLTLENEPSPVPDEQIEAIERILKSGIGFEVTEETFEPGEKLVIQEGVLGSYTAEVVDCYGMNKLILRIDGTNLKLIIAEKEISAISGDVIR